MAKPLRKCQARCLEARPFISILEWWNRNQFVLVEPVQRCID
jgi:hypothetical protein